LAPGADAAEVETHEFHPYNQSGPAQGEDATR
jgi:hypothetical protein